MKETTQMPMSSQQACLDRKAHQQKSPKQPDAYEKFLKNTSQESKDRFYHKLAGMLLKE